MEKAARQRLVERIRAREDDVREWYKERARAFPPPFYSSVDLRDAGFKVGSVDCNFYPAGFNNVCPADRRAAPTIVKAAVTQAMKRVGRPEPKRMLILPEAHSRNPHYGENLYYLREILVNSGYETVVGWLDPDGDKEPFSLPVGTSGSLEVQPIEISGGLLSAAGFVPDAILLNNDFSAGYPPELDDLTQPILPSHVAGWHSRRKGRHFRFYNEEAESFAKLVDSDPWLLQVETEEVEAVDFNEGEGIDRVAEAVSRLLSRTRERYAERSIRQEPFAFVKSNTGTYGMGIMVVRSAEELSALNRRTKNKMSVGKNRTQITSVVVQEGIPTAAISEGRPAEPVIYLVGCELIGGFLRTHPERDAEANLNAPGMVFKKLCVSDLPTLWGAGGHAPEGRRDLEIAYGSVARLSSIAAGRELAEHLREPGPRP